MQMDNIHGLGQKPTPLCDKVLEVRQIQGAYLNIMKAVYSKFIANINLNEEKFKAIL